MDRRLPRDEDGLAPDRGVAWRWVRTDRPRPIREGSIAGAVERRVFVNASPRVVWATLHDPANAQALFPQLRLDPPAPAWPAAASTRRAETRARASSATRPASRASRRDPSRASRCGSRASGFSSELRWRLEPLAGGTRVVHAATFDPHDRWAGILVRLGRESLANRVEDHLRTLKERAEADQRVTNPAT